MSDQELADMFISKVCYGCKFLDLPNGPKEIGTCTNPKSKADQVRIISSRACKLKERPEPPAA